MSYTTFDNNSDRHVVYIDNADKVSFPDWEIYGHYEVYASYDNEDWFNLPTTYDAEKGQLCIIIDSLSQAKIHLAFFPPYTYARHLRLIEDAQSMPHCTVTHLGKTTFEAGRDITLLTFGTPEKGKKEVWLIARQHPGEPQAEWYAEQLVRTLNEQDEAFFEKYTFRLVPNMNPDGTYLGNLRTNGHGKDLNRQWCAPSAEKSPEIYFVLNKMQETGVDFFMDIHSDEAASEVFFPELAPQKAGLSNFIELYKAKNSRIGDLTYGEESGLECPKIENIQDTADGGVSTRFGCLAFTLEMPTKNSSIEECYQLARDFFPVFE